MPNEVTDLIAEQAWESLIAEAIVNCLSLNTPLLTYLVAKPPITRQNPESLNSFSVSHRVMVWHDPTALAIDPQPGDSVEISCPFVIGLVLPQDDKPILPSALAPTDWLLHMQRILEIGMENDGQGKLINPLSSEGDDPIERHLNRVKPRFKFAAKRPVGANSSLTLWPLLALYEGRSTRTLRRLSP